MSRAKRIIRLSEQEKEVKVDAPDLSNVLDGWVTHWSGVHVEYECPTVEDGKLQVFEDRSWHWMVRGQIVESGMTYQSLAEFLKDHLGVTINKIEDEPTESLKEQEEGALTKAEVMEQVQEMAGELTGIITRKCKEALGSGALDVEDYKAGDYSLAKLILSVSLKRAAEQYVPLGDKLKKEYKNLLNFV